MSEWVGEWVVSDYLALGLHISHISPDDHYYLPDDHYYLPDDNDYLPDRHLHPECFIRLRENVLGLG